MRSTDPWRWLGAFAGALVAAGGLGHFYILFVRHFPSEARFVETWRTIVDFDLVNLALFLVISGSLGVAYSARSISSSSSISRGWLGLCAAACAWLGATVLLDGRWGILPLAPAYLFLVWACTRQRSRRAAGLTSRCS